MNDDKKVIQFCNFLREHAYEIVLYIEDNKISNRTALAGLCWLFAYIIEPPKDSKDMYLELVNSLLADMLDKMYSEQNGL